MIGIALLTLSRRRLERTLAGLVALEHATHTRLGVDYAEHAWDEPSFRRELPGKWRQSRVAVRAGAVVGLWIASRPAEGEVHTHRVAVAAEHARAGLGRRMFESVAVGAARMTLEVAASNHGALAFYDRLGFVRLDGAAVEAYLARRGRRARVVGGCVVEPCGHRTHVLGWTP
jgi:ribosomal protein S18 acetylase RimI-like enzyme